MSLQISSWIKNLLATRLHIYSLCVLLGIILIDFVYDTTTLQAISNNDRDMLSLSFYYYKTNMSSLIPKVAITSLIITTSSLFILQLRVHNSNLIKFCALFLCIGMGLYLRLQKPIEDELPTLSINKDTKRIQELLEKIVYHHIGLFTIIAIGKVLMHLDLNSLQEKMKNH